MSGANIGGAAWGDGDGGDMTFFIAHRDMARYFIIPFKTQHVAVVCDDDVTVNFYKRARLGPELIESVSVSAPAKATTPVGIPPVSVVYRNSGPVLDEDVMIATTANCGVFVDSVANAGDEISIFGLRVI